MLTHNCDALSLIGQLLDHIIPGDAPVKPQPVRYLADATLDEMWEAQDKRVGSRV